MALQVINFSLPDIPDVYQQGNKHTFMQAHTHTHTHTHLFRFIMSPWENRYSVHTVCNPSQMNEENSFSVSPNSWLQIVCVCGGGGGGDLYFLGSSRVSDQTEKIHWATASVEKADFLPPSKQSVPVKIMVTAQKVRWQETWWEPESCGSVMACRRILCSPDHYIRLRPLLKNMLLWTFHCSESKKALFIKMWKLNQCRISVSSALISILGGVCCI